MSLMSRQKTRLTRLITPFPPENEDKHYDDCQCEQGQPNIYSSLKTQRLIKSLLSQIKTFFTYQLILGMDQLCLDAVVRHFDGSLNFEFLVLGSLDEVGADRFEALDVPGGQDGISKKMNYKINRGCKRFVEIFIFLRLTSFTNRAEKEIVSC